ncbi:hypothetical protein [Enterobacter huaxiensis]|nr:hypothetical protein [Enterobacter huaxiensis]MCS5448331.1 hypothetical protein [Enterobacter huaxiensis]
MNIIQAETIHKNTLPLQDNNTSQQIVTGITKKSFRNPIAKSRNC